MNVFECDIVGLYWLDSNVFQGSQYAVSDSKANWAVSKYFCEQDNATLGALISQEEQTFLRETFEDPDVTYAPGYLRNTHSNRVIM